MTQNVQVFLELVRAGLVPVHGEGCMVRESFHEGVDWGEVYLLAEEQSVIGLVAAGIEAVQGEWLKVHGSSLVPQAVALQFVDQTLQIEQRNKAMNAFVAELIELLRKEDVYAVLVKGQGIAQCYEKPLWRSSGDVDLLLSEDNYEKAKAFLAPQASSVDQEGVYAKHIGMTINGLVVELHGRLRCGLSGKLERVLDEIQKDTFYGGSVSSWNNDGVQVFKLSKENEVFYVFAHFLGHFYKGGIGLRQICDWCRLLYTYRDSLNYGLLESWIRKAGLVSEWKAFYNLATKYLGMSDEFQVSGSMFQVDSQFEKKAERIMEFILEVGNFGHNRDMSFYKEGSYLGQKVRSFGRRMGDLWNHLMIFPMDTLRFFPRIMWNGVVSAVRGE